MNPQIQMKNIKKKMNDLVGLIKSKKKNKITFLGSLYSLTYLTISIEPILQDSKNLNPEKEIENNIDRAKTIFETFDFLSNYSDINGTIKTEKNKNFYKMHENLWQNIQIFFYLSLNFFSIFDSNSLDNSSIFFLKLL
jgi:hypothetical protein